MTGLKIDRVNKVLTQLVKADIFRKIEGRRGVYRVNPFIIGKGEWKDIKELRANFDFQNGTFVPEVIMKEDIIEK